MYCISEAVTILGVCTKTIRRWDKSGLIICFRTIGGHRRISAVEIAKITNSESIQIQNFTEDSTAVYCRVSSHDQKKKGDLELDQCPSLSHFKLMVDQE